MRLAPLLEIQFRYSEFTWVGPIEGSLGKEHIAWGLADGSVSGERVRGTHKACNHPRRRGDNVNLPDVHGLISTEDGSTIYYEIRGFGLPHAGTRLFFGTLAFRTASERYAWLNTTVAVGRGVFVSDDQGRDVAPFRVYEVLLDEQEKEVADGSAD